MINLYFFIAYCIISIILFVTALWAEYKWIPIILGGIMTTATIISFFVKEIPFEEYFNLVSLAFWITLGIALVFSVYFSIYANKWWAGLIAGIALVALVTLTLIDILIYGVFPLIPGANISIISMITFISMGSLGIIAGKSLSDKKQGFCIPFFEDCSQYDCKNDKITKCLK